jgi:hypothetical protein
MFIHHAFDHDRVWIHIRTERVARIPAAIHIKMKDTIEVKRNDIHVRLPCVDQPKNWIIWIWILGIKTFSYFIHELLGSHILIARDKAVVTRLFKTLRDAA